MNVLYILIDISIILLGINTLLFTFFCKVKRVKSIVYLLCYVWSMLVVQLVSKSLASYGINNLYLSHFYFILQFITVSYLYKSLFNNALLKKIITYTTPLVVLAEAINYAIVPAKFFQFNTLEVYLCSIPIATYAVIYLFRSIDGKNKKWIYFSGGLMLYLLSSSLVFSGADVILQKFISKNGFLVFWALNNIVYIIYQLLVIFEWYENFRKPPQKNLR